jgi:hypothetical protein
LLFVGDPKQPVGASRAELQQKIFNKMKVRKPGFHSTELKFLEPKSLLETLQSGVKG